MRPLVKTCVIILVLGCAVYVVWIYAHRFIFYRQTVLEVPIRLEQGFSLNREFRVDMPANYWVGIRYDEVFRSTVKVPVPQDEFTAESEVRLRDKVIANGGTMSLPGWTGPWASNRDQVTRYLTSFRAKPGNRYSVLLRITGLLPGLVGKNPKALVEVDPRLTLFHDFRKSLFIYASVAIGIVILLYGSFVLRSRWRSTRQPKAMSEK